MVYLYVGIAGALGAMLRYAIGTAVFTNSVFPFATLLINLAGSFLLAWLTTRLFKRIAISPELSSAVGTGFVGSFTTFSTLSVETVTLFQDGHLALGIIYIIISIAGGLVMSRLGFQREEGHAS